MLLDIYRQVHNATRYSLDGLGYLMSSEFAARLEVYAFFWVSCLLIYLQAPLGVLVTTFILFCVLIAVEALNTAIEVVVDRVSPEISEMGKRGKDLGSFSVMCLMAANGVNFLYALSQCNWTIATHTVSTTGGAILLSGILLYIGVYILARRSPLKPVGVWLTLGLVGLYLTGIGVHLAGFVKPGQILNILGPQDYTGLVVGSIAYGFICLVVLSFVHDLLSSQKFRLSIVCLAFIKRRVNIANRQPVPSGEGREQKPIEGRHYLGLPVLVLAVMVNPFSQELFQLI